VAVVRDSVYEGQWSRSDDGKTLRGYIVKTPIQLAFAIMAFTCGSKSSAAVGCGTYPEAVYEKIISAGWSDCNLKKIGEPPLWEKLPSGQTRVSRFVFTEGHGSFFRFITISEQPDGTGQLRVGGGDRGKRARTFRRSALSSDQIARLNSLASQSSAWKFDIGSWDGDEIYMHCQLLEMEKMDAEGYRYSSVNIGCNHPTKLMPFVNEIVRLSGLKPVNDGRLFR
jgi:hypothetical protein